MDERLLSCIKDVFMMVVTTGGYLSIEQWNKIHGILAELEGENAIRQTSEKE